MAKRRFIISENDLLSLLKAKDERGFNLLYDNYSAALHGIALKIVRDQALAQDIIQDTFIKIWDNFDKYDSQKGSLFTWILNICRNKAIDKIRSTDFLNSKQTDSVEDFVGIENDRLSHTIDVDNLGLSDLIGKLKPEQKLVVETLYYQGYTQSEASIKLGIPLGTVKTRAKSALQALKELLD